MHISLGLVNLFCSRGYGRAVLGAPDQSQPVAFVGVLGLMRFKIAVFICMRHRDLQTLRSIRGPDARRRRSSDPHMGGGIHPAGGRCSASGGVPKSTIKIDSNHNKLSHSGMRPALFDLNYGINLAFYCFF